MATSGVKDAVLRGVLPMALLYAFLTIKCAGAFHLLQLYGNNSLAASQPVLSPHPGRRSTEVIVAIRKTGKFNMAASLLDAVDLSMLPESSTLFVPQDNVAAKLDFRAFNTALPILEYHIVTRELSFRDLQQLPIGTTLETLLKNCTVLITSNSSRDFTVDDVTLTHPDIYLDDSIAVHGIAGIMNASVYGKKQVPFAYHALPPSQSPRNASSPKPPKHSNHSRPPLRSLPPIVTPGNIPPSFPPELTIPVQSAPSRSPQTFPPALAPASEAPNPHRYSPAPQLSPAAQRSYPNVTAFARSGAHNSLVNLPYMTKTLVATALLQTVAIFT